MTLLREDNDTCSRFLFVLFGGVIIFLRISPTYPFSPPFFPLPQVLDKAIMTLYALLPAELKMQQQGQQQPQAVVSTPAPVASAAVVEPAPAAAAQPAQVQKQDSFGDWDPFGSTNEAGKEPVSAVEAEMVEIVQAVKQSAQDLQSMLLFVFVFVLLFVLVVMMSGGRFPPPFVSFPFSYFPFFSHQRASSWKCYHREHHDLDQLVG